MSKNNKKNNNKTTKKNMKKDNVSELNINDSIQSAVSILFTIVIIILVIFLVFVLYNNFIKKEKEINILEVCNDYIKKDYHINEEDIKQYLIDNRHIIYNINDFDLNNIQNKDINDFIKYIIWNDESEYIVCDEVVECLDTKKEMNKDFLISELNKYLNKDIVSFSFPNIKEDDKTRLYIQDDKVILTFKNMEYETYKHDIVDIRVDEKNIYVIYALSKKINDNEYSYVGNKKVELIMENDNFMIKKIKTIIN